VKFDFLLHPIAKEDIWTDIQQMHPNYCTATQIPWLCVNIQLLMVKQDDGALSGPGVYVT
jgi:hypothetical protein